jgi:hypothetical protein
MKNVILILAVSFPAICFAQQVQVSFSTGWATFNMQSMRAHQAELQSQFPVNVKIVESFPSFLHYEVAVTAAINMRFKVGLAGGYSSTGGRMHYSDYSGEITCEQLARSGMLAVRGDMRLNKSENFPIYVTLKAGVATGRYDLDVQSRVNDEEETDHQRFQSMNIFIEPGIILNKRIYRFIYATVNAGYNLNVSKGKLYWTENKNFHLFLDENGDDVQLDWSGVRASCGLTFSF